MIVYLFLVLQFFGALHATEQPPTSPLRKSQKSTVPVESPYACELSHARGLQIICYDFGTVRIPSRRHTHTGFASEKLDAARFTQST